MRIFLLILILCRFTPAYADEETLDFMFAGKAGVYQAGGNLFADKSLHGFGFTMKLIPDDFGKAGHDNAWLGGINWLLSFDLDHLSGQPHQSAPFPFSVEEDIQLTWSVLAAYVCAGTQHAVPFCVGLPLSNSLYLEQNLGGESFNSFSMSNGSLPVFFSLVSSQKPWNFGLHGSTSYWNPIFAGMKTHFNLIQAQMFVGYMF